MQLKLNCLFKAGSVDIQSVPKTCNLEQTFYFNKKHLKGVRVSFNMMYSRTEGQKLFFKNRFKKFQNDFSNFETHPKRFFKFRNA